MITSSLGFFLLLSDNLISRVQAYSLRSDTMDLDIKGKYCWLGSDGVYCRGFYYWWNTFVVRQIYETSVISFDMSEEEFHSIQLPQIAQRESNKVIWLIIWNESVNLFLCLLKTRGTRRRLKCG